MKDLRQYLDERTVALGLLALSIVTGIAYPPISGLLEPVALPALFLVVIFSLMPFATLPRSELISINPDVWRILLWQQIVLPGLLIAAGVLARFPDYIVSLVIVTACSGALFAAPALAALLDLNRRSALQCMVLTTISMPLSLYLYLSLYHSANMEIDIKAYIFRVLIYLVIPFGLFIIYRYPANRMSVSRRISVETAARWAVIAALAVFGIGMMRSVSIQLASNPMKVLFFFLLTTFLCIGMLAITSIVMYRYGLNEAMTAAVLSGFRNVGLGYALIGDMIGPELAVYVGVSLLPVFTAPLILKLLVDAPSQPGTATA